MTENLPSAPEPLALVFSSQNILALVKQTQNIMREVMVEGEHYGVIPGTSGKKSLLKSGAEKLCFAFGLSNKIEITSENLPGGHREYRVVLSLHDRFGVLRGQGVGLASTMESKHRYRGAAGKTCPKCGAQACRPSKKEYGGGYYCDKKSGGCDWKTKSGTAECRALDNIIAARSENPDPADQYNTVLKMAKKRALVDATLTATAASDIFAQDLEDIDGKIIDAEVFEEPEKHPETPKFPEIPAAEFEKQLPGWRKLIADGKKTDAELVAFLRAKYTISAEQIARIAEEEPGNTAENTTAGDAARSLWERLRDVYEKSAANDLVRLLYSRFSVLAPAEIATENVAFFVETTNGLAKIASDCSLEEFTNEIRKIEVKNENA